MLSGVGDVGDTGGAGCSVTGSGSGDEGSKMQSSKEIERLVGEEPLDELKLHKSEACLPTTSRPERDSMFCCPNVGCNESPVLDHAVIPGKSRVSSAEWG